MPFESRDIPVCQMLVGVRGLSVAPVRGQDVETIGVGRPRTEKKEVEASDGKPHAHETSSKRREISRSGGRRRFG